MNVSVIIPALNEEDAIGRVISEIPRELVQDIIVADNGSSDCTRDVARRHGARVVVEKRKGYGAACLAGLRAISSADIVVFLDGDYSDFPGEMSSLVKPIMDGEADFVLGSRVLGKAEKGALLPQARYGNRLAVFLIRILYGYKYTDMGPFRAIRRDALTKLGMSDTNFGWTAEMQVKALKHQLRIMEIPVSYRKRTGHSKITGTVSGTMRAGYKIIFTILKYGECNNYRRAPRETE